jgi:hypothetical protein
MQCVIKRDVMGPFPTRANALVNFSQQLLKNVQLD